MFYLISDTHFNHTEQMIEWCKRPNNFEELMFKGMSSLKESDTLIHLGDICMGKDQYCHNTYIKPLKCKKILILGNHDNKSISWYLSNGWDFVCDSFTLNRFGKTILFSHSPKVDLNFDLNIHGHLHNTCDQSGVNRYMRDDSHLLFAVEFNNYCPVSLDKFILRSNKDIVDKMIIIDERYKNELNSNASSSKK